MDRLSFDEQETAKIKEVVELYLFVKKLLLYNENIDPESYTFPQVLNELRNSYDHFNRALAVKLGFSESDDSDYSYKNLDKSLGHIYRALYDTLDWLNINVAESIENELEPFSAETIKEVIPNYFSETKPKILEYNSRITEIRYRKDISSINHECLKEYSEIVAYLIEVRESIISRVDTLIEYESRKKKESNKNLIYYAIISIISAIVGGIIGTHIM